MAAPREEVVEGIVEEVSFRSDDGRFTVARFSRDAGEPFVAVGSLGAVSSGETLRMTGRWVRHAVHGEQLKVSSFTPVVPHTSSGIARYLGSGLIPGIGASLAKRLVDTFGDKTLDVIVTESARLREVEGIGRKRAAAIAEAVREKREEAESLSFLHSLGLGPATARRILDRYGKESGRVLKDDPYLVAEQIRGIGFRTADQIGRALGIGHDDPRRAAGATLHVLGRAADSGHTYLSEDELIESAASLDVPPSEVSGCLPPLALRGLLVLDEDRIYPPPLHRAEKKIAERLAELARPRKPVDRGPVKVALEGFDLSADQRAAVEASLEAGLMVLTGGPGTGKTTTVRAVVAAQRALGRRILLAAPTGRAAKRLNEATGAEARTIHRLLEWTPHGGRAGFRKNADEPLDAEVVLVDEASMLNVQLAEHLVAAIAPSSRLILVGDVDQLPPVGPGPVLREVLRSGVGHVTRLTEVFRQAEESAIVRGAHAILHGRLPEPTPPHTRTTGDLFFVKVRDREVLAERLLQVMSRIAKTYGIDPRTDVQVLVPMRRGALGVESFNRLLQQHMNPNADASRPGALSEGDKVMQLSNDYEREVFNGDLGTVRRIQGGVTYVMMDGREVKYGVKDLDALALAYASTVHKVQGSEFPAVVIVMHAAHHVLLNRALLYTALTRAKKLAVLVGDPRAFARAVKNADAYDANCYLARRLERAVRERGDDG